MLLVTVLISTLHSNQNYSIIGTIILFGVTVIIFYYCSCSPVFSSVFVLSSFWTNNTESVTLIMGSLLTTLVIPCHLVLYHFCYHCLHVLCSIARYYLLPNLIYVLSYFIMILPQCFIASKCRVATNLEKLGNLKVGRENRKSQGKYVLDFRMPAITLFQ